MHVRHPASPRQQGAHVAARLGALQSAERRAHLGHCGVFGVVRRDNEEEAGVRAALVQLPSGVEVARTEAKRGRAAERAGPRRAHLLEPRGDLGGGPEVSEDRDVVSPKRRAPQRVRGERRQWLPCIGPRELGARQRLRFLDVGLIERIDAESLAQLPRGVLPLQELRAQIEGDRKSTRLNSSHLVISYAVFCLKKKKKTRTKHKQQ